jgi:phenol hydroxylase P0 protein
MPADAHARNTDTDIHTDTGGPARSAAGATAAALPPVSAPSATAGLPCWVRVRERRPDGFVEFDLSIGDPMLSAELILPAAAFARFCAEHAVQPLDAAQSAALDAQTARWREARPPSAPPMPGP